MYDSCLLLQIREYEQVIIEDRIEKEKTRKKIQQDDLELKSIIKAGNCNRDLGAFLILRLANHGGRQTKHLIIKHGAGNLWAFVIIRNLPTHSPS